MAYTKTANQMKSWFFLAISLLLVSGPFIAKGADEKKLGKPGLLENDMNPVLVKYYLEFLENQDVDQFVQNILARYNDGTLLRLVESGNVEARRAAVLALGLVGGPKCNEPVAACMKDSDPVVRSFSEHALWGIWFRSDTPVNNQELTNVRNLISDQRLDDAMKKVNALIEKSPNFAEAWNQRAIVHFMRGDLEKSVADCREVVKLNPFHFGAMSGMSQCLIQLGEKSKALEVYRNLQKIQPYNEAVKAAIQELQTGR